MLLTQRNGTTFGDGVMEADSGELDWRSVDEARTFNGESRTNFRGECGRIRGSADGFYPSFTVGRANRDAKYMPEKLDLFTHQACRLGQVKYPPQ